MAGQSLEGCRGSSVQTVGLNSTINKPMTGILLGAGNTAVNKTKILFLWPHIKRGEGLVNAVD